MFSSQHPVKYMHLLLIEITQAKDTDSAILSLRSLGKFLEKNPHLNKEILLKPGNISLPSHHPIFNKIITEHSETRVKSGLKIVYRFCNITKEHKNALGEISSRQTFVKGEMHSKTVFAKGKKYSQTFFANGQPFKTTYFSAKNDRRQIHTSYVEPNSPVYSPQGNEKETKDRTRTKAGHK